jgi:hypothetical protein
VLARNFEYFEDSEEWVGLKIKRLLGHDLGSLTNGTDGGSLVRRLEWDVTSEFLAHVR